MTECYFYNLKNTNWETTIKQAIAIIADLFRSKFNKFGPIQIVTDKENEALISNALWRTKGFIPNEITNNSKDCVAPIIISKNYCPKYKILVNLLTSKELFNNEELNSTIILDFNFANKPQLIENSRKRFKQLKKVFPQIKYQEID